MTTPAQIAIEGTDIKLYRSDNGLPEGKDGLLFVLIPCLHNFMKHYPFDPGKLLADIAQTMGRSNQAFELKRTDYKKSSTKDFMVQWYQKVNIVEYALDTFWRPDTKYIYIVRANEHVEVHKVRSFFTLRNDLDAFKPQNAMKVVVPENPSQATMPKNLNQKTMGVN